MADSPFMLRPAARAAPPGFPPDVAPNQIIYAAHINAIRDSVAVWPGNVDGNLKTLSNVGALGVGTASPSFKLDVAGGRSQFVPASEPYAIGVKYSAASPVFWIGAESGGDLRFSEGGGIERVRITQAGRVGIGTAAPGSLLHVRTGADQNLGVSGAVSVTGAVALSTVNDAASLNIPMELRASFFSFPIGNVGLGLATPLSKLHLHTPSALSPHEVGNAIRLGRFAEAGTYAGAIWNSHDGGLDYLAFSAGTGADPTGSPYLIIKAGGVIQMYLGGSLKTLSVDGSGFVKAT